MLSTSTSTLAHLADRFLPRGMTDAGGAARYQGAKTALPGSNPRCGCAHGARQASACARRGGKGGLRPVQADYRGARAAGQCRGQFQLFSHQRAARRRAHVTTGVVAATSHYRRARSYLSFGPQPADMSENRLQRVAKDGAGWIHNPGWNIVLSVPTGAGPSVGVWRSQLPSVGGGGAALLPQCGGGRSPPPPVWEGHSPAPQYGWVGGGGAQPLPVCVGGAQLLHQCERKAA
mmetsp:Transcript_9272/g.21673  ORF Transcript_9272/g.21673 Transcript_9272/m.21673 type:complete len:233 (-) Transcript_9272:172-870(-)